MAQYFREFRDLTSDHENFPHENLVLLWAWLPKQSCVRPSASERVEPKYVKAVSDSVRLLSKKRPKGACQIRKDVQTTSFFLYRIR